VIETSSSLRQGTATLPGLPHGERTSHWHLITPEYPPQLGGVSDYTCQVAAGLSGQGDEVHVWCPEGVRRMNGLDTPVTADGVTVHRECGSFRPEDLRRIGQKLDRYPGPRRLLVQWVPHGYGYRSMNLPFCWWLWNRAVRHGDRIELMVHEPFLTFDWAAPKQNLAALTHRSMTMLLLNASSQVWMSIPGWEKMLRPYALGRKIAFRWLPIPSNIPVSSDQARVDSVRRRYVDGKGLLIGHFGTYGSTIAKLLEPILSALADDHAEEVVLLIGNGSEQFRQQLIQKQNRLEGLLQATGPLEAEELSCHLAACDLLIQPYPDGVSSRRTSFMAGLSNGKPMVTTTGWLTEPLWIQGGAVAVAPAGDTGAFVEHVRRLRTDAVERLRLGSAASRLYQECFDLSHTISSLRQPETAKDRECAS
jgi:glycosyltransferase involved in cell wall biosynthesis